ncbi:MBL fold metallo-hydrolase [Patulibacter minatonensis]|uniref:MBL fold metallo-hydrolase n=1 Tax=Patulibacter minatonensis TaxID=298163 RepID=UPI00047D23DC|nr:MBL fold metallo-hydrolase [Patulibacter minatonensis]
MAGTSTESPLVEEVAPGITRIALPLFGIAGGVNVHLVRGDGPTTLVDAAMPLPGALEDLEAGLRTAGSSLDALELLLVTHHHLDHMGLAAEIHGQTGVPIAATRPVADAIADPHALLVREVGWGEAHIARHGAPDGLLDLARAGEPLVRGLPVAPTARVLTEGDVVRAGDHDLVVRVRPGHSPTDTLFVESDPVVPGRPVAFVGDHVFRAAPLTPVLGSMLGTDQRPAATYLRALEETAAIPGLLALTGHGPALADVAALHADRRGALDRRTGRVRDALTPEPRGTWDLGLEVWRGVPSERHGLTRLGALLASLELLEDEGAVVQGEADGRVTWAATAA